jgi:hypothetical protein
VQPRAAVAGAVGVSRVIQGVISAAGKDTLMPLAPIDVPVASGTRSLRVTLTVDGDSGVLTRRADLYLYSCGDGSRCERVEQHMERDGRRQERIVMKPEVGLWRVVVDPVRVRGVPLHYTVRIVATNVELGSARFASPADSAARDLAPGARWRVPVSFQLDSAARGRADVVGVVDLYDGTAGSEVAPPVSTAVIPLAAMK